MKKLFCWVLVLVLASCGASWAQTPAPTSGSALEDKINTKIEWLQAEILFQVLDLKKSVDFDVLGQNKGFNRRLSRVTAKLVNIKIPETVKLPLAEKYLQANANEIDMSVKYRSTFANGYFASGPVIEGSIAEAFFNLYKKNKNATFKGIVAVRVAVPPQGEPKIHDVHMIHVDVNYVK